MFGAAAGFFPVWIEDDPQRVRPVLERGARSCIGGETHHSAADGIADDPCRCAFAGDARLYLDLFRLDARFCEGDGELVLPVHRHRARGGAGEAGGGADIRAALSPGW